MKHVKDNKIMMFFFTLSMFVSCRGSLTTNENVIAVYAPNNYVEVRSITQTHEKKTIPIVESISGGEVYYVECEILNTESGAIYYPDMDYNFYLTASDTNEYYVFPYVLVININGSGITPLSRACELYGTDVVVAALKEQAPQSLITILTTQTQTIEGSFFQPQYRVDLTIN